MNRDLPVFVLLRVLALVLAQVFVFNKLSLFGSVTPMVYVIFLYLYPTHKNQHILLSSGFVTGLLLDLFLDSLALHTIALTFMCYIRPKIMRFTFGLNFEQKSFRIQRAPIQQRYSFLILIVIIHHFIYFSVEALSFSLSFLVLKKVVFTSFISFVLSVLLLSLFSSKKS